jgi:tetratricopeptide (TPR) repeat protein
MQCNKKKPAPAVGLRLRLLVLAGLAAFMVLPINPAWAQGINPPDMKLEGVADPAKRQSLMQLLDKGEYEAAAGRFDQAREYWRRALEQEPGWEVVKSRLRGLPAREASFPLEQETRRKRVQARLDFVEGVDCYNAGRYQVSARLFEQSQAVIPDDPRCAEYLKLARAMHQAMQVGGLQVSCATKVQVYIDGALRGSTPLKLEKLPVGGHRLEVACAQFTAGADIDIQPRAITRVDFKLYEE